jgi:hypothetical protein
VLKAAQARTPEDEAFHRLTDRSVADGFVQILGGLGHSVQELDEIIAADVPDIMRAKLRHNRPRPWQISPGVLKLRLDSTMGFTPAYPAGHAWQARTLARHFKGLYPVLGEELDEMARRCKEVRVKAGLHYPSD